MFCSGPDRSQTLKPTLFAAIAAFDEPRADGQRSDAVAALDDIALILGWAEPMPLVAGANVPRQHQWHRFEVVI
jgi:hypothetical protein